MAWTTPRTWVTGAILTAAQLNTDIRDNSNFFYTPPRCLANSSGGFQSVANNDVTVVVAMDNESFDTDGMHDNVTLNSHVTVKTAGVFFCIATYQWASNNTGRRKGTLLLNGGIGVGDTEVQTTTTGESKFGVVSLRGFLVNDYLQNAPYQNSGGALNLLSTLGMHWLSN